MTAVAVGGAFLLLYLIVRTPGVGWYDSPELVGVATDLGIAHPSGYPLFSLVGRLGALFFTWLSDPAVRINLLCSVLAALTLGVLVLVTARLGTLLRPGPVARGIRLAAAALPSLVLGALPLFAEQAVAAEVYSLHTLMVALLLLFSLEAVLQGERPTAPFEEYPLRKIDAADWGPAGWRLPLFVAYLAGLALGNHATAVLYFPAILWLLWWAANPEAWQPESLRVGNSLQSGLHRAVPLVVAGILGLSIYLLLPIRSGLHPPFDWGGVHRLDRLFRLVSAAEARARPAQFDPVTFFGLWGRIGHGMGYPLFAVSTVGWVWACIRRGRLIPLLGLYVVFPLLFLLLRLDLLEDALLPMHMLVGVGSGLFLLLVAEQSVMRAGPVQGRWAGAVLIVLLLAIGPAPDLVRVTRSVPISTKAGPTDWIEAVAASVAGAPEPAGGVRGWVFSEENTTAFLLWYQSRVTKSYPYLRAIYLLLVREAWYQEEMRRDTPSLHVPDLPADAARLPPEASAIALVRANRGVDVPLFLSPIMLPPPEAYGTLVPQGVLLRIEEPGYEPTPEDIRRHVALIRAFSPAIQDSAGAGRLDDLSRSWWSYRHKLLGDAWARLGYAVVAESEYLAGTRLSPEQPALWVGLGRLRAVLGDWEGASRAFARGLALEPKDPYLQYSRARSLAYLGAWAKADSLLPASPAEGVDQGEYLRTRAMIRIGQGRLSEAEADLRRAATLDPENGEVLNDLGVLLLQEGNRQEAEDAFRRATQAAPAGVEAWANLGTMELQDGLFDQAAEHLRRALDAGGSNAEIGYQLGLALYRAGRLGQAEAALRTNLQRSPDHADSYYLLGAVLEIDGRRTDAIRAYEAGRMAAPGDPRFADALRRLGAIPPEADPR